MFLSQLRMTSCRNPYESWQSHSRHWDGHVFDILDGHVFQDSTHLPVFVRDAARTTSETGTPKTDRTSQLAHIGSTPPPNPQLVPGLVFTPIPGFRSKKKTIHEWVTAAPKNTNRPTPA